MEVRPNGRKEAIEFVWRQPDAALTLSQKQSITAALAKDTDETASLYFLAPLSEQWVGILKGLLAPTGTFHRAAMFFCIFTGPLRVFTAAPSLLWLRVCSELFCTSSLPAS